MKKFTVLSLVMGFSFLYACAAQPEETPVDVYAEPTPVAQEDLRADIVVIGAGGAGMSAALQAHQEGVRNIVIVEQMPMTGGNTTLATGGMNAAGTRYQEEGDDYPDLMFDDTMRGGNYINDEALVRILADYSAEAVYWLNDNFNAGLVGVGRGGGAGAARFHRPADGTAVGPAVVRALNSGLAGANIPVMLNTTATEILLDDSGQVVGIVAERGGESFTIYAGAVILASGGFGANPQMLTQWDSALEGFGTTNHVGATGSGIEMAVAIGAALVDMEHIQTHPTVNPATSIMFTEAMRGEGALLINMEGQRFVDELDTRDVVSEATLAQTDNFGLLLFDTRIRETLAVIESYINAGIITSGDSPAALARALGIDPTALEETIEGYNAFVDAGVDQDFGRNAALYRLEGPYFYAGITVPAVHHTMGGVAVNPATEVVNQDGAVIPGLFAAGEVIGGVHGDNRLAGNAVADIIVFGRIAGTNAAEFVRANFGLADEAFYAPGYELTIIPEAPGNFTDGVFEGVGRGYGGDLVVQVTVENGNIVDILLLEHNETYPIYAAAEREVIGAIISTQNLRVDTTTAATLTSNAIMDAVANALR